MTVNEVWGKEIEGKTVTLSANHDDSSCLAVTWDDANTDIPNVYSVRFVYTRLTAKNGLEIDHPLYVYIELYHLYVDGTLFYTETVRCKARFGDHSIENVNATAQAGKA